MSDRELLELAAKAAGLLGGAEWFEHGNCYLLKGPNGKFWTPLDNDGDALRLAVCINANIEIWHNEKFVRANVFLKKRNLHCATSEKYTDDPYAATRRAIVRAAAAIGAAHKGDVT